MLDALNSELVITQLRSLNLSFLLIHSLVCCLFLIIGLTNHLSQGIHLTVDILGTRLQFALPVGNVLNPVTQSATAVTLIPFGLNRKDKSRHIDRHYKYTRIKRYSPNKLNNKSNCCVSNFSILWIKQIAIRCPCIMAA